MANVDLTSLKESIQKAAERFNEISPKEVVLLHHNDTDGLSSGAILSKAFERYGAHVRRYALEKPYPRAVQYILSPESCSEDSVVVFADFGSGMLPKISEYKQKGQKLFVLDHHVVSPCNDDELIVVNCHLHGVPESHSSASAISFAFVEALQEWNSDLAYLGLLGALGDGLLSGNSIEGLNLEAMQQALKAQDIVENKKIFFDGEGKLSADVLIQMVDSLGSIGYFRGGPDVAVKGLLDKEYSSLSTLAMPYVDEQREAFDTFLSKPNISISEHVQWFDLKDTFKKFGVKTVGLLCQKLREQSSIDESKYIAGFQHIPLEVPGIGNVMKGESKISMRLPNALQEKVKKGESPGLDYILLKATEAVGGFVDACHPFAAATTISIGKERDLINHLDKIITESLSA